MTREEIPLEELLQTRKKLIESLNESLTGKKISVRV
jgi:hypothetical protein